MTKPPSIYGFAGPIILWYKSSDSDSHVTVGQGDMTMDDKDGYAIDARIAELEAELQQLKVRRTQQLGRQLKALDQIKILDLSRFIFGPFCTQMLADMGAEVIKVEPLGLGDPGRNAGNVSLNGVSTAFLARNRNKRSIALDFRRHEAHDILAKLTKHCDVLVHNFRPGIMAKMELNAKQARAINPQLIYCSLSGYGQTGPLANWPGQDLLIQAMGGIISTTGWEDGPPVAVGPFLADVPGALTATFGILAALQARSQYGIGQEMQLSLLDALIALQSMDSTGFLNSGQIPPKSGSGHWMLPQPYGIYQTKDKPLAVNAHSEDWWGRLCKGPAFAHLNQDDRYNNRTGRARHGDALTADLQQILLQKTRDEWLTYLAKYDVLCAPVYNYQELFDDPQVHHNGIVVNQEHPLAGNIRVVANPVKLSATPADVGPSAPALGAHTSEILTWLDYSPEQIAQLAQDNIIS
jgi:crotonobetainyl-CoA:carnitine CoA-transferase CaiB-like acyl-CoA transferase